MGIRFHCHHCENELHVKDFLAGKVGKCPNCSGRFRVPAMSTDYSLPVERIQSTESTEFGASHQPVTAADTEEQLPVAPQKPAEASNESVKDSATDDLNAVESSRDNQSNNGDLSNVSDKSNSELSLAAVAASRHSNKPVLPKAFSESIDTWYLRSAIGGQYGPASTETMKQWLSEGRITSDSYLWREGWVDWLAATDALSDYFVGQIPPPPSTEATNPPEVQNAVATVVATKAQVKRTRRKNAQLFLIIGLSLLFLLLVGILVFVLINRS